jgi:RimJ/RimL family protein N-acetyltransferase
MAAQAVRELVTWASSDARLERLTAETAVDNLPSRRVLEVNNFRITGTREDAEDGSLLTWERMVR